MPIGKLPILARSATQFEIEGREHIMFAGCDYLGLSHHPLLVEALIRGARQHGISSSGSRTTSGNRAIYDVLESALAGFLGTEDAVIAADGYIANLLAAQAMQKRCSIALVDADAHVSVADAVQATRMRPRSFRDLPHARTIVHSNPNEDVLIATDGLYPAACKIPRAGELLELLPKGRGALLIDDCHAFGVLGERGRGSLEYHSLSDPRVLISGTFSKAIGCHGGFVAGSRAQIEALRLHAHAYVGSTAFPAAIAEAVLAALKLLDSTDSPLPRLHANLQRVRRNLAELGLTPHEHPIPVFALKLGSIQRMRALHEHLYAAGLFIPLVEYPDGQGAYLRLALCAAHTEAQLQQLHEGMQRALADCR